MKKTSKILSLLVALCMTLAMFSGITAMAADLELVSFNADSDFITLDFNQAVDAENAVILLTKNGEAVEEFTFAQNNYNSYVQTGASSHYTYFVTPAEGIEIDAEYKLTLHEVKSADGTATFGPWAKTFTVANIGGSLTNYRTVGVNEGRVSYNTSVEGQVSAALTNFTTSYSETNNAFIGTQVGADFENEVPMTNASLTSGLWTEKDYTVKLKIAITGATKENIGFGIADNVNRIGYKNFTGTYMYMQRQTTSGANFELREDRINTSTSFTGTRVVNGGNRPTGLTYSDLDLKLATKGQVAQAYIEGKKVADLALSADAKGWVFVTVEPITASSGSTALNLTVSDFLATRATFADAEPDVPGAEPEPDEPAVEPLNPALIADWDADLDFVTLDFTEDIGTLQATLTQAGTQVPVTVSKADHANMEANLASRYTYIIKPISGGLTRDIPYTLSIANVKGEDDEITTWSKTFKVEVIGEGLTINDTNEILNYNTKASYSNVNTDDLQLTYSSSGARAQIYRAVGNDTDSTLLNHYKDSPYTEKDYTVKATFKSLTGATKADFMISTAYNYSDSYGLDHGWFRGVGVRVQVQSKTEEGVTTIGNNANMYMKSSNDTEANGGFTVKQQSAANITGIDTDAGVELKLSTKNKFARAYVNGGKVAGMPLAQDYAGMAQIHATPTGTGATVVVADFIATRAVPVLENVVEFTAGEATVTGSFASGTVSIAATLNNTTASAKNIFAVCALYDASDVMKNIVISPVGSIANTGETELTFANVAANGATKAKIFIWDSAAALNPWFPAIIAE